MKTVLSLMMAVFLSISVVEPVEAKRFGSGGFGKAFKVNPFKKASPQKAVPANGSALAGNKAAGRKPGMGGLMGGLLAGGMFAYLLGNGAFEGLQFMDILLFALIGFVLFKLFAGRKQQHAHQHGYQGQSNSQSNHQSFESLNSGMHSSGELQQGVPMELPAEFDLKGFTSRAVEHYTLVHKAWDEGDMSTVKEYLDDSLYGQLEAERKQDSDILNNQILDLDADIVRSQSTANGFILSVLFRGRMKDLNTNQEQGVYDVWHLEQVNGGPWLIVGIEAE